MIPGEVFPAPGEIVLNAGAALLVGGKAATLCEGVEMAAHAIASGAARGILARLVALCNEFTRQDGI